MIKHFFQKFLTDLLLIPLFRLMDLVVSKNKNYWAFTVHFIKTSQFIENTRAVFEEIKSQENIKKVIFTRETQECFGIENSQNVVIVKMDSLYGLYLLSRCKVVFLSNSISMDYSLRWGDKLFSVIKMNMKRRLVVNVWHGIALKKMFALSNSVIRGRIDRESFRVKERMFYKGLVTSSDIDSYAMATMFYPIKYENIWLTGLPRNDFLVKEINFLPQYLSELIRSISRIKEGRKLITYAPTYRQTKAVSGSYYYQFTNDDISSLKALLIKHNAIFGFRMHYFRNDDNLFNMEEFIDNELIFDLGHEKCSEIAAVIRETDLFVTDYSGTYTDALYLNKPIFSFAYDLEQYSNQQEGFLYDIDISFPGAVVTDFKSLIEKLDLELASQKQTTSDKYKMAQKLFFKYIDEKNSKRVVEKVMCLLNNDK